MERKPYNHIYGTLVKHSDDFVGMLSYAVYKSQKIEFIKQINEEKGRNPTNEELLIFHTTSILPHTVNAYREQGSKLAELMFLNSFSEVLASAEQSVKDSVLQEGINDIKSTMKEKNNWKWWIGSTLSNIAVNFLTIITVGLIVFSYKHFSEANSKLENTVGISATQNQKQ